MKKCLSHRFFLLLGYGGLFLGFNSLITSRATAMESKPIKQESPQGGALGKPSLIPFTASLEGYLKENTISFDHVAACNESMYERPIPLKALKDAGKTSINVSWTAGPEEPGKTTYQMGSATNTFQDPHYHQAYHMLIGGDQVEKKGSSWNVDGHVRMMVPLDRAAKATKGTELNDRIIGIMLCHNGKQSMEDTKYVFTEKQKTSFKKIAQWLREELGVKRDAIEPRKDIEGTAALYQFIKDALDF